MGAGSGQNFGVVHGRGGGQGSGVDHEGGAASGVHEGLPEVDHLVHGVVVQRAVWFHVFQPRADLRRDVTERLDLLCQRFVKRIAVHESALATKAFSVRVARVGADRNAIIMRSEMLDLPTRLGDAAVSRFLTEHLDGELSALGKGDSFERALAEHRAGRRVR